MSRIRDCDSQPRHREALAWVNALVLDLKKQLHGYEPGAPITRERLDEWQKHAADLERCRDVLRVRR